MSVKRPSAREYSGMERSDSCEAMPQRSSMGMVKVMAVVIPILVLLSGVPPLRAYIAPEEISTAGCQSALPSGSERRELGKMRYDSP